MVAVTPFAGAGTALLLGGKLFTNHITQLMDTGLENVEMFRGECVGLQTIHRKDSNSAACV
jgi:hypothetical protein